MIAIKTQYECPYCHAFSGIQVGQGTQHMMRFDQGDCPEYSFPLCECSECGTSFSHEPIDRNVIMLNNGNPRAVKKARVDNINFAGRRGQAEQSAYKYRTENNIMKSIGVWKNEVFSKAGRQVDKCLVAVWEYRGRTAAELANLMQTDRPMLSRRLSELRKKNLIYSGKPRTCLVSGRQSMTWFPVTEREYKPKGL